MEVEPYKYEAHVFRKPKSLPWSVCTSCGLVSLNNKFTQWSVDKGCNNRYHSSYANARKKYTGKF